MKDIEKIVKDALQNHEFSYDPQAWNALESKLPKAKSRINFTKWTMVGFAAAALSVSAFIIFSPKDSDSTPLAKKQVTENQKTTSSKTTHLTKNKKSTSASTNSSQVNPRKEEQKVIFTPPSDKEEHNLIQEIVENYPTIVYPNLITNEATNVVSNPDNQKPNPVASNDLKIPIIEARCLGDVFDWVNPNGISLFLKAPNGTTTEIKSKEKAKIQLNEVGVYSLGKYSKNGFEEKQSFKIKAVPTINLSIENELNYENGLAILKSSVDTYESRISWRSNNIGFDNGGKTANLPIYNKGRYEISVSVVNDFGCETTETKTFISKDEYNLLAVNALNLNSNDNRNNTFMPFALKQRNTPFKLIIIDPNDGGIVFESSDASFAWEGIDKRDGKKVNPKKAYIWKVTLLSPEKGEKSEYKGTITLVE
jgi:hypothetical protein